MLKIDIIEKKYGAELVLEDLFLEITKPGIYGLIGKNGIGKTTLFKCALGLEKFIGTSKLNDTKLSLSNSGFCPAEPFVYEELTAVEFYRFYAKLFGINLSNASERLFIIPEDKLIKDFSTGMKKKVYLNAIFQKDFPVYFLDEPFNGLDIESNYILTQYLKEKSNNSIIIISSHIFEILYKICVEIYLISNKKLSNYKQDVFSFVENDFFK